MSTIRTTCFDKDFHTKWQNLFKEKQVLITSPTTQFIGFITTSKGKEINESLHKRSIKVLECILQDLLNTGFEITGMLSLPTGLDLCREVEIGATRFLINDDGTHFPPGSSHENIPYMQDDIIYRRMYLMYIDVKPPSKYETEEWLKRPMREMVNDSIFYSISVVEGSLSILSLEVLERHYKL